MGDVPVELEAEAEPEANSGAEAWANTGAEAVPDKLVREEKDDSEEKLDPGAEAEAGKVAVVDLELKDELEKYWNSVKSRQRVWRRSSIGLSTNSSTMHLIQKV